MSSPSVSEIEAALRASLTDLERLKQQNSRLLEERREPIAIVGMSCRYPGAVRSPEEFWELIAREDDVISAFPEDRGWELDGLYDPEPGRAGTCYVRHGGFLDEVGHFDATFFGIGPREALAMDPQQRLLLEASWEALEDSGVDPRSLRGSATGVFAGISLQDYLHLGGTALESMGGYRMTGGSAAVLSGRIAYALGLEGPAMTIDTACSSSLVSLHLACQALRSQECSLALAGGVTVLATPALFVEFSRQRGLSSDGRCKAFSDRADGTSLAEGVGMLVLQRLSDAMRESRRVLAVVKGSAVNQDGASNGLTAPNGPSQQRVIEQALASAGLSPNEVDAVEAHGTGTVLGDPIEAQALIAAYGHNRDRPLWLGSVKSNIGHAQAAAGVAGVIKMVMALRNGMLPRTLHVDQPSTRVDWPEDLASVLCEQVAWPINGRPRRAGVSSFGISGTNAHVILEEAPIRASGDGARADLPQGVCVSLEPVPLVISAKDERALRAQAARLSDRLRAAPDLGLVDVGLSLATRCTTFAHRAVCLADDRQALLWDLDQFAQGQPCSSLLAGVAREHNSGLAMLFGGQGAQRVGMGKTLYDTFPVFAEALDETCALFDDRLDCSLRAVMFGETNGHEGRVGDEPQGDAHPELDATLFTQTSLFAFELALFRLLESLGLRADCLAGHSVGELAAVCAAGALSLEDACAVVGARARLMSELPAGGAMVAVQASEGEVLDALRSLEGQVALAAVNGPSSVVVSGEEPAVLNLSGEWESEGRKVKRLRVSHAFHSPLMDDMLAELRDVVGGVSFEEPRIPIASNLTGGELTVEQMRDPGYWARHVRETVRFADCVQWLRAQGAGLFLEVGPDAVLSPMVEECVSDDTGDRDQPVVAALLRKGRPELHSLFAALGQVWAGGADLNWGAILGRAGGQLVSVPGYAFQRERYWLAPSQSSDAAVRAAGQLRDGHPLLGAAIATSDGGCLFTGRLSLKDHPWLGDHVVAGRALLPGTAFLDLAFHAGMRVGCDCVDELVLQAPLALSLEQSVRLQVRLSERDASGARSLSIHSCGSLPGEDDLLDEGEWVCHATGSLGGKGRDGERSGALGGASLDREGRDGPGVQPDGVPWPPEGAEPVDVDEIYDRFAELGFAYGPAFQGLVGAWLGEEAVFGEVELPAAEREPIDGFGVHPALLDAALHGMAVEAGAHGQEGPVKMALPFCWRDVALARRGAETLRVRLWRTAEDAVSLIAWDEQGQLVVSVGSLTTRPVSAQPESTASGWRDATFCLDWREEPVERVAQSSTTPEGLLTCSSELLDALLSAGVDCHSYVDVEQLAGSLDGDDELEPTAPLQVLLDMRHCEATDMEGASGTDTPDAAGNALHRLLGLLQQWLAEEKLAGVRLVVLTERALETRPGEGVRDLAAGALWGMVRSAQLESPDRLTLVDVDGGEDSWRALSGALALGEDQVALRDGRVMVPRLADVRATGALVVPQDTDAWRLDTKERGTLDGLALVAGEAARVPLGPREVRVGIRAAGLNFRDVLVALGTYPGEGQIGGEAAGVVLEVGEQVRDLAVGDRVMGLLGGAIGTVAVTDSRMVVRMPDAWSFVQAASVPIAFATAYYALVELAGLKAGESVLIHSAAGGVGMAAVKIARHLGAEVFATASERKWRELRGLGLDDIHLASSRTPAFRDAFLAGTGGQGVNVVLNSLTGEMIDASLTLLSTGGRFLEMGKVDVRDPAQLERDHPGIAYRAFDLLEAGPERIQALLTQLVGLFQRGTLRLSPITTWNVSRAPHAFRRMANGGHVGKNVLRLPARIDREATVLLTGATGGIGRSLARHLVARQGVRHLLLLSRKGAEEDRAIELLDDLSKLGAVARLEACDVSDRERLRELLQTIPPEHPLDAVFHVAGVVDDGLIGSLTEERVDRVLAAKVRGAWNLHELTGSIDLSTFVLFSSVAATFGSAGQASYAAANAFLDALALHRREAGLSGTSIAWGQWDSDSEMTQGMGGLDRERVARLGLRPLSGERGLALLDEALVLDEPLMVAVSLEMSTLRKRARAGELSPVLEGLVSVRRRQDGVEGGSLERLLADAQPAQREGIVLDLIRSEAARVLGHRGAEAVTAHTSFKELGLDSLAGVELRNRLAARAGVRLPATLIFDYPTPAALARHLLDALAGRRSRALVKRSRAAVEEPVAIVGMACRYPGGANSPEQLWRLVRDGEDAISAFPDDRGWQSLGSGPACRDADQGYRQEGGFLKDAAWFDAGFFEISPREALAMDPQQRLLLETCWEAVEDAQLDPRSLHGSQTGVFAGIGSQDYHRTADGLPPDLGGHGITGGSTSVASGRIAYTLGLEGPAVTVDTACSSSLVALHLACQSLRLGECSLALAGGATVISSPAVFNEFARQGGLSSDARCRAFADGADGVGWGEGIGVLLLERLCDARRLGHRVLAVIPGSAVNQDGASNGLTAPNGPSQQRVIMQALTGAGLSPADVDVVEAHGTGTRLGDPIEAQALLATYGLARDASRPLRLGSIKSNIGHTQAAAGVAGVIKTVLAVRHSLLPRTLHVDEPSREVDWSAGTVELLREEVPWIANGRPRRGAVSSFGISGTNAHVIVEEPPADEGRSSPGGDSPVTPTTDVSQRLLAADWVPWVVSARSEQALREQGARLLDHVQAGDVSSALDVGLSLTRRCSFEHRAVVVGGREQLLEGASALALGGSSQALLRAVAPVEGAGGVAFVFPGQGSQWVGMAGELLACSAVFAERVRECAEAFSSFVDWSLLDVLSGSGGELLERVDVVQPALFAVMVGLASVWRECGVEPTAVVGHSQGEIAAAYVAGGLSLRDAAQVVALRSRALRAIAGEGGMVSVALSSGELAGWLEQLGGELSLAAVNGPRSSVVSGSGDGLARLLARCASEGVKARKLPVDYAAHSPHVERIRRELLEACASIEPRSGEVPFYSSVTGGQLDMAQLDAGYWYRNLRETVRFDQALATLLEGGCRTTIECSPHPVLAMAVQEVAEGVEASVEQVGGVGAIGTLRRGEGGGERFVRSLAEAWTRGVEVDWRFVFDGSGARAVPLPTYPFQRERYWLGRRERGADPVSVGLSGAEHPLLGAAARLAGERGWLFTGRVSLALHPWLADHAVLGTVLVPGTALLELALYAGRRVGCPVVGELVIEAPMVLEEDEALQLQVAVSEPDEQDRRQIGVYSRRESQGDASPSNGTFSEEPDWVRHAEGTLQTQDGDVEALAADFAGSAWPPSGAESLDLDGFYERLADIGLEYGSHFQGVRRAWRMGEELFCEVALADEAGDSEGFAISPVLLDCALQAALSGERQIAADALRLPFAWSAVKLRAGAAGAIRALRVRIARDGQERMSLSGVDEHGIPVIEVKSLHSRSVSPQQLQPAGKRADESIHHVQWVPLAPNVDDGAGGDGEELVLLGAGSSTGAGVFDDLASLCDAVQDGSLITPRTVIVDWRVGPAGTGAGVALSPDGGGGGSREEPQELSFLPARVRERTVAALALAQQWLAEGRLAGSMLVFLTSGAVSVAGGDPPSDLAGASLWGLIRSAQLESAGRFGLLDVEDCVGGWSEALKAARSLELGEETQLAIRDGVTYAPRLIQGNAGVLELPQPADAGGWRLQMSDRGTFEGLRAVAMPEADQPQLERGQLRVAMRAAGVNFHDIVTVLGLVGLHEDWDSLGGDGAGVVLEVGPDVEDIAVGDRVMGLFHHAFGSCAVTDRELLAPMPDDWSFARAAAMPTVFLTAFYALVDLAEVKEGERVLVHAAAGGVGMAAVQLARWLGAEVLVTASPAKWPALRELGIDEDQIASSRDAQFKERFLKRTEGGGVDVVLNSLTGELTEASLDLLAPGGRFVEMGKTDVRDPAQIAERWSDISYRAFDLVEAGAQRTQSMLAQLLDLFADGTLRHPPLRAWDMRRAAEAFRFMAQARHVGKIALTLPAAPSATARQGTVLVTGGTGVLGRLLALHLAQEHGVRHMLLASRHGRDAEGARELEQELEDLGVEVSVCACDVCDPGQLSELLGSIDSEHPLRAVVHAAGALDDGPIGSLTPDRLEAVMRSKVDAAWHLHELTRDSQLDAFVLYSSAAGVLGSPGQANYCAANAFLDALAAHRRAQGLPAVSIAWGLWEQASGLTAEMREVDLARVRRSGIRSILTREGLAMLDAAWSDPDALAVPIRFDRAALRARVQAGELPAVLRSLVRAIPTTSAQPLAGPRESLLAQRLKEASPEERTPIVLGVVRAEVAAVLGHANAEAVDVKRPLKELGFDSLLAVELRNRLSTQVAAQLPATLAFDYPTPEAIARHVLDRLAFDVPTPSARLDIDRMQVTLSAISGEEAQRLGIAARLGSILARWESGAEESSVNDLSGEDLDSATDDEIFELIDREFGVS